MSIIKYDIEIKLFTQKHIVNVGNSCSPSTLNLSLNGMSVILVYCTLVKTLNICLTAKNAVLVAPVVATHIFICIYNNNNIIIAASNLIPNNIIQLRVCAFVFFVQEVKFILRKRLLQRQLPTPSIYKYTDMCLYIY